MPVHVHVPIRIVVDTATVSGAQLELEDALRKAFGRALENAYETAVTPRGGYADLKVDPPTFRWTGEAVDTIDDDRRTALEERLKSIIEIAVQASPMADHERIGADAPVPLPDNPSEPLDPSRLHRAYGLYELPSYDDGDDVAVEVEEEEAAPDEGTPVREAIIGIWEWQSLAYSEIRKDGNLTDWGHFYYNEAVERFGEPASEWRGLIFRDDQRMILDFNDPVAGEGKYRFITIPVSEFLMYVFMGRDANPPYARVAQLPYPGVTTLKQHGPFTGSQRVDVVRQFMEADIRARTEREYPNPNPRVISAEEHRATIDKMIENEINRRSNDLPEAEFVIYELKIGDYGHLIPEPASEALNLPETVHLVPITYIKEIKLGGEGEGEGTGAGGGAGGGTQGRRGGGGGYGQGAGGQGEQGEQPGGFVFAAGGEGGKAFYPIVGGDPLELELGPFEEEPKLDELGADAEIIRAAMKKVAFLLQAPEAEYAATFALNALAILGARAAAIGIYAGREQGFTQSPRGPGEKGKLGYLDFRPEISPAIQFLRHLASTVPDLHDYTEIVRKVYYKPEHASKFGGRFKNNVVSWFVRFNIALADPVDEGVSAIFVRTCQVLLLQLLRSSHQAIMGRLSNFSEYSRVFEQVLLPELHKIQDLIDLRDDLKSSQRAVTLSATLKGVAAQTPATPVADWAEASRLLLDTFVASNTAQSRESGERGEIVVDNGEVKIFDGQGRLWTLQGLEQAIQYKRGFVEAGDPLVKQLADLEKSLDRFSGNSAHIQLQLLLLLVQMKRNNEEQQEETTSDSMHAFEMGQISEDAAKATIRGTTVPLQGIHLMAHETVGEFFRGDDWYGRGVDHIFSVVLGMRGLRTFFEVTIVLGLSVVCPPLGTAVGAGLALYQYAEALEKKQLYESLIDPELVISRAQLEAELFAAQLGVALSFIPEAGSIVAKGLGIGVRAGTRAGARVAGELAEEAVEQTATRGIGRAIIGRLSREAAESLKHGVLVAFAREIVTDQVMDALVGKLMIEPIVQEIYREYLTIGPGLHGRGLTTPAAGATAGDRPATDADGNPITYNADGSVTVTFRRGAGVDVSAEPPEGGE